MQTRHYAPTARELGLMLGYARASRSPFYVIHTDPASTIGGFSCEALSLSPDGEHVVVRIANGDKFCHPLAEITIRIAS